MTIRLYLDTRASKREAPIKLLISVGSKIALISLDIKVLPEHWDKQNEKVIGHPLAKRINLKLSQAKLDAEEKLFGVTVSDANEAKRIVLGTDKKHNTETFMSRFLKFADTHKPSTRGVYLQTYRRLMAFDKDINRRSFEDIDKDYLTRFQNFLAKTNTPNALAIHMRNIRAVFNDSIDANLTQYYPFRRFKIKYQQTAKRSLTVKQLRTLFECELQPYMEQYRDMFKLMFFFMGINMVDLFNLKEIRDGRIEYHRAKTGHLYSIKVEPEALEIIERYRGKKNLLYMADHYSNHLNYLAHFNDALKRIGELRHGKQGEKYGKPLFPELSSYWARHTYATIAVNDLNAPFDLVSKALGHSATTGAKVTSIYVNYDSKKIDLLNRDMIDWVIYGKKSSTAT